MFCYCPTPRAESWEPFTLDQDLLVEWTMCTFEDLISKAPFGNGRVQVGFAFDGLWLPKEVIVGLFQKVKQLGVKTITSHYTHNPIFRP